MTDFLSKLLEVTRHWHNDDSISMIKLQRQMRNCLLTLIAFCLGAPVGLGQRISGELRLRVTDPTGGAIRAVGTIVGQATGVDHPFETDENGRFTLRGLPLGKYGLTIQSEGFSKNVEL